MPLTAYPFIISAWEKTTDNTTEKIIVSLHENIASGDFMQLSQSISGRGIAQVYDGVTAGTAQTAVNLGNTGVWTHLVACFQSAADRTIYLNGTTKVNDTTSVTINTPNIFYIGRNNWTQSFNSAGQLAEVSIWDGKGFTDSDRDSFVSKLYNGGMGAQGSNPLNLDRELGRTWRNKLVGYWSLNAKEDLNDYSGNGYHLTMAGTLTNPVSHPFIEPLNRSPWSSWKTSLPYYLAPGVAAAAINVPKPTIVSDAVHNSFNW